MRSLARLLARPDRLMAYSARVGFLLATQTGSPLEDGVVCIPGPRLKFEAVLCFWKSCERALS